MQKNKQDELASKIVIKLYLITATCFVVKTYLTWFFQNLSMCDIQPFTHKTIKVLNWFQPSWNLVVHFYSRKYFFYLLVLASKFLNGSAITPIIKPNFSVCGMDLHVVVRFNWHPYNFTQVIDKKLENVHFWSQIPNAS